MESYIEMIVMYTISNDDLRGIFREKLLETFKLNPKSDILNESAYHIHQIDYKKVEQDLHKIRHQIEEDTSFKFEGTDMIDLYYSAALVDLSDVNRKDRIVRRPILKTKITK